MLWTSLFAVGIAQGLFLISIILYKGIRNVWASYLIGIIILLMVISNIGYLVIRTELVQIVPQVYGLSWGTLLLLGPLFYFYSQSVLDKKFRWHWKYGLHFIPYALQLAAIFPYLLNDKSEWIYFVNNLLSGNLPITLFAKVVYAVQCAHLSIYVFFILKFLKRADQFNTEHTYIVPISARIKWLKNLSVAMILLLMTVIILYMYVLFKGQFDPVTNYVYTLISSSIIYFVAYSFILNPAIIAPDFDQKYKTYMSFVGDEGVKYLHKIEVLLNDQKIFTNPDLKLAIFANELELPAHQVSKLINEKYGKSFNDLINEYRVKEFIHRIHDPTYQNHTVLGIAMDSGFNSKSSFNSAFKKITGKTPSEYKGTF